MLACRRSAAVFVKRDFQRKLELCSATTKDDEQQEKHDALLVLPDARRPHDAASALFIVLH